MPDLVADYLIERAAVRMTNTRVGGLLGVLSRTDLLRQVALGPDDDGAEDFESILQAIETREVSAVMSTQVATISAEATILAAAKSLVARDFNRLMVTDDESGKLVGIISTTDVVRIALCDELSEVSYDDE